jgi:hypothetical protein
MLHDIVEKSEYTHAQINELYKHLEDSVLIYTKVLHERDTFRCEIPSFDFEQYESKSILFRKSVEKRIQDLEISFSTSFELGCPQISPNTASPVTALPVISNSGPSDVRQKALTNISTFDISENFDLPNLLSWVKRNQDKCLSTQRDSFINVQLVFKRIEIFVFSQFQSMFQSNNFRGLLPEDSRNEETFVKDLSELLNCYSTLVKDFLLSKYSSSRMKVNIKSHHVLVCICALCFIFESAQTKYPMMRKYCLAISRPDLEHLVLSGSDEIEVLKTVSRYLQKTYTSLPIFHLGQQDQTRAFAKAFGENYLSPLWDHENSVNQQRVESRWDTICQKKKLLVQLRASLKEAETELDSIPQISKAPRFTNVRQSELQTKISKLQKEIRDAVKAPSEIVQPLPRQKTDGYEWIFFLFMPTHLNFIATFTLLTKQLFVTDNKEMRERCSQPSKTKISEHFSRYSQPRFKPTLTVTKVIIETSSTAPSRFGSQSVDKIEDKYNGVFYPDAWDLSLNWKPFNPFHPQINKTDIDRHFTENLPQESQKLASRLQINASLTRGNVGLASQESIPNWLSKSGYLTFTSLRAFPFCQIRNLIICFKQRSLPFGKNEVQILVRQLLFQVGPISSTGSLEWRGDVEFGALRVLANEVKTLAIEWRDRQRDPTSFLLLAEISAYLSQFDPSGEESLMTIIKILGEWTSNLESSISENHDPSQIVKLRHRQCLYNMYSIICLGGNRPLPHSQLELLCRLSLLVRSGLPDDGIVSEDSQRITDLLDLCYNTLVIRLEELLAFVEQHPQVLTQAIRAIVETIPDNVSWSRISGKRTCFESWDESQNHYAINILSGVALINGLPPRALPASILDHPLYRRSFGDITFETILLSNGWIENSRPVRGRKYRLNMNSTSKELIIQERRIGDDEDDYLQLLDVTNGYEYLPVRLRVMHSHWYSQKFDTMILRPILFHERNVSFTVRCFQTPLPVVHLVPSHKHSEHIWRDFSQDTDFIRLTNPDIQTLQVLSKFEDESFIHFFSTPSGSIRIDIPRFLLSFEYVDSSWISLEDPKMKLSPCQQLPQTLTKFSRYLVLQSIKDEKEKKLIIPRGTIEVQQMVNIVTNPECSASCSYYTYFIHPRFGTIESSDVESRIYLASLYDIDSPV